MSDDGKRNKTENIAQNLHLSKAFFFLPQNIIYVL